MFVIAARTFLSAVLLTALIGPADCELKFCTAEDAPPKPGVRCGHYGSLPDDSRYRIGDPQPDSSVELCRKSCFTTRGCHTFGFDDYQNSCSLYSKNLRKLKFYADESDTRYWTRQCFIAKYYDTNPTVNGGFEEGLEGWESGTNDADKVSITTDTPYAVVGQSAFDITISNPDSPDFGIHSALSQDGYFCKDVVYDLTFSMYQPVGGTSSEGDELPGFAVYYGYDYVYYDVEPSGITINGVKHPAGTAFQFPKTLAFTERYSDLTTEPIFEVVAGIGSTMRLVFDNVTITARS